MKGYGPNIIFIKNEQSKIRSEEKDIKERWKEHLKKLLKIKNKTHDKQKGDPLSAVVTTGV